MNSPALRVLVVGATGLVGGHCVTQLRREPRVAQIVSLQRRDGEGDTKLRIARVDFDRLDALDPVSLVADAAICALGSTIRKAGSQEAFRRIDHDYVLGFARLARRCGVKRFGLVSALGAGPRSRVFYNRVKGEAEAAIELLGFASLTIAQPSLLLGEREDFRVAERLFAPVAKVLPRRWRAVAGASVAAALVDAVLRGAPGVHRLDNASLLKYVE